MEFLTKKETTFEKNNDEQPQEIAIVSS